MTCLSRYIGIQKDQKLFRSKIYNLCHQRNGGQLKRQFPQTNNGRFAQPLGALFNIIFIKECVQRSAAISETNRRL